ncbi:hypothetical protein EVAR_17189_1 [Eumeta japonica]|uniref:Uncharacterized protein n=1 Tax=Eumeta variegata TaxID=151549 RepID=A0A4C1U8X3_EUMVA|nr:hypothetical protein EVAR_17189_1 [Eumeta japonica]
MVAVVCDKINAKEEELKATLANHLCCTSLDKKDRRLARTFMSIVNLKSLSFTLLRIADVGVRLPIHVKRSWNTCDRWGHHVAMESSIRPAACSSSVRRSGRDFHFRSSPLAATSRLYK